MSKFPRAGGSGRRVTRRCLFPLAPLQKQQRRPPPPASSCASPPPSPPPSPSPAPPSPSFSSHFRSVCERRPHGVRRLLCGAPRGAVAPLRPSHLRQSAGRPRPRRQRRRCPKAKVRLVPCLLSRPSHLNPRRLCTVVEGRRQLHGNRHALVTVSRPEPAIPAPLRSASHDGAMPGADDPALRRLQRSQHPSTARSCTLGNQNESVALEQNRRLGGGVGGVRCGGVVVILTW